MNFDAILVIFSLILIFFSTVVCVGASWAGGEFLRAVFHTQPAGQLVAEIAKLAFCAVCSGARTAI